MIKRFLLMSSLICFISFCMVQLVHAQDVTVSITVIKASNANTGIDASIKHLQPKLKRLNYSSYSLLKKASKIGPIHTEQRFVLPDGDTMRIRPIGIESGYVKMFVAMDNAGLKTNFKISNGKTVIVGGNEYEDGSMVIAVSVSYK